MNRRLLGIALMTCGGLVAVGLYAQPPEFDGPPGFDGPQPRFDGPPGFDGPPRFEGPPSFGGGPGGRGFGGPMGRPDLKLVKKFDANEDGWLNREERDAAREELANQPQRGPFGRGGGRRGRGPFGGVDQQPPQPGPEMNPADVESYPDAELYDTSVLRTLFLDFESDDWESELEAFKPTDVEVPARLTVDGNTYENVGVSFRGMSSFMMVPAGKKRSLNLSVDMVDKEQRLYGHKTLNLLNASGDPSLLSTVLYSHIAREHIPAPEANLARVVINGEYWGVYTNVQQFNKVFAEENYGSSTAVRWKVSGSPNGDGGLRYTGDDLAEYRRRYTIKSKDDDESWQALVELCRTLNETPLDQLEAQLTPLLDIDAALWFLALDVALVNSDGYWTRASDYSLLRDEDGRFHVIPHDMNEAFALHGGPGGPGGPGGFRPPRGAGPPPGFDGPPPFGPPLGFDGPPPAGGPGDFQGPRQRSDRQARNDDQRQQGDRRRGRGGRGGGPGHGGPDLDPLVGLDNDRTPLRSRLLAVPELRERYLQHVRDIAQTQLDWRTLGPLVAQIRGQVAGSVEQDTRKLSTYDAFIQATSPDAGLDGSLRGFCDARREFLLNYKAPR
ncbi:CotH protein [Posidoniimonas polymericola]|uniref:CotH protein n=1 Tax=Posidoniimonas polymericola TaxID=2528002 RepID=A0A5C5ZD56_9BACT|nr:CotH kinase family protein [Posidoniimonas polymericola]TWT85252.1 CotH protein [Posidoniimonas polymericola]